MQCQNKRIKSCLTQRLWASAGFKRKMGRLLPSSGTLLLEQCPAKARYLNHVMLTHAINNHSTTYEPLLNASIKTIRQLFSCSAWLMWLIKSYKWWSNEQRRQCNRRKCRQCHWNTLQSLYSDHRCMCDMKKEIRGNLYATAGPAPLSYRNVMTLEKWSNKSLWKMIPPDISPMTWIVLMSLPSIPCSRLQSTLHPAFC